MDLQIAGKTALIAGASAGLGFASAKALAENGVQVAICSRDRIRIDAAAKEIGHGAVALVADVSNDEGVRALIESANDALGGIDILVANSGGPPPGTAMSTAIDAYRAGLEFSMLSTVSMCLAVAPGMKERGWGRIVAITSSGARNPIPFLAASSAARAGVTSFLKNLASELAPNGVTVNSAQPGMHATARITQFTTVEEAAKNIPTQTIGDPRDFGRAVAFLCSDAAKFITGTGLLIDGGQSGYLL
jgi:3-oxoacyl-[acyl-carrier protein] reductase